MFRFETFKDEILKRAKEVEACTKEYKRAIKAESFSELIEVIKDNIGFCIKTKIIDAHLLKYYEGEFESEEVYCNKSAEKGLLLAWGDASVMARGNTLVKVYDNASVEVYDNASAEAWGDASVEVYDNASVEAYGKASVKALDNTSVEAWDNASVKAYDNASVEAWGDASVEAWGDASVKARGNAYVYSYSRIECKLKENAIYRCKKTNTIYYANDNIKFERL